MATSTAKSKGSTLSTRPRTPTCTRKPERSDVVPTATMIFVISYHKTLYRSSRQPTTMMVSATGGQVLVVRDNIVQ